MGLHFVCGVIEQCLIHLIDELGAVLPVCALKSVVGISGISTLTLLICCVCLVHSVRRSPTRLGIGCLAMVGNNKNNNVFVI